MKSYVAVLVKFVNDDEFQENFFCCKMLSKTSKEQDIFNICIWENGIGICTGIAPSMVVSVRGFTLQKKKERERSS
jgi:hypothetical protein